MQNHPATALPFIFACFLLIMPGTVPAQENIYHALNTDTDLKDKFCSLKQLERTLAWADGLGAIGGAFWEGNGTKRFYDAVLQFAGNEDANERVWARKKVMFDKQAVDAAFIGRFLSIDEEQFPNAAFGLKTWMERYIARHKRSLAYDIEGKLAGVEYSNAISIYEDTPAGWVSRLCILYMN